MQRSIRELRGDFMVRGEFVCFFFYKKKINFFLNKSRPKAFERSRVEGLGVEGPE